MPTVEPCWHECFECGKGWHHGVISGTPLDEFFSPCPACLAKGFDAVAHFIRREHAATNVNEFEDFSVLLPEKEQAE